MHTDDISKTFATVLGAEWAGCPAATAQQRKDVDILMHGNKLKQSDRWAMIRPIGHPIWLQPNKRVFHSPALAPIVSTALFLTWSPALFLLCLVSCFPLVCQDSLASVLSSASQLSPPLSPSLHPTLSPTLPPSVAPALSHSLSSSTLFPTLSFTLSPALFPTLSPTLSPSLSPGFVSSTIPLRHPFCLSFCLSFCLPLCFPLCLHFL